MKDITEMRHRLKEDHLLKVSGASDHEQILQKTYDVVNKMFRSPNLTIILKELQNLDKTMNNGIAKLSTEMDRVLTKWIKDYKK